MSVAKRGRKRTRRLTSSGRRGMSVTRFTNAGAWLKADMSPVRFLAPRKGRRGSGLARVLKRQGLG